MQYCWRSTGSKDVAVSVLSFRCSNPGFAAVRKLRQSRNNRLDNCRGQYAVLCEHWLLTNSRHPGGRSRFSLLLQFVVPGPLPELARLCLRAVYFICALLPARLSAPVRCAAPIHLCSAARLPRTHLPDTARIQAAGLQTATGPSAAAGQAKIQGQAEDTRWRYRANRALSQAGPSRAANTWHP